MFCQHCGSMIVKEATHCQNCGAPVTINSVNDSFTRGKSKLIAGLLAIFLGYLGIHNFYLGYKGKAIAQLLLTFVGAIIIIGPLISTIWSLIEGIVYLASNDKKDANGNLLV